MERRKYISFKKEIGKLVNPSPCPCERTCCDGTNNCLENFKEEYDILPKIVKRNYWAPGGCELKRQDRPLACNFYFCEQWTQHPNWGKIVRLYYKLLYTRKKGNIHHLILFLVYNIWKKIKWWVDTIFTKMDYKIMESGKYKYKSLFTNKKEYPKKIMF